MTTLATDKTVITFDYPDWATKIITLRLETTVAINSAAEVIAQKDYPITLDANGLGFSTYPTPDSTGALAWLYRVNQPDGTNQLVSIAYDAASQDIATILAASVSTITPSALSALVTNKQDKDTDAVNGNAAMFDANGNTVDAGGALGTAAYADTGDFEAALGNPLTTGQALVSTDLGVRSWSTITAADRVAKAGDTMTGALVLSGAPTIDLHAATKKYVDDNAGSGGDLLADGSVPMTGTLSFNPGADDAAKSWTIPITSADNANINFNVAKTVFETVDDVTFNLGFNNSGGGREDGAKPALYLQFENNYKTGVNQWFEYHLNVVSAGGTVVRPFEYKYERDATQGTATYVASTYTWTAFNGYNAMQMQTNGTLAGTQITFAGAFTMSGAGTQAFVTNGPLYVKSPDTTKGVAIVADNAGNTVFARQGASGNIQFTNWATMEIPGAALYPTAWTIVVPVTMGDGKNFLFNTTTGTKFGTTTTQKFAFWNATPVVQQVLAVGASTADIISLIHTLGLARAA